MITLDRESMAEDVKRRLDALAWGGRLAVEAIVETEAYSLEEALKIVESGGYEFHLGVYSLRLESVE